MTIGSESTLGRWSTAQCPFVIDYEIRVLHAIRQSVVEAFFSLPRGGVEIGGILLGTVEPQRLLITGHAPLDCEHSLGPSFTLSPTDLDKLEALLASASAEPDGPRPVGWYHSHTRSEIFLTDADQELHNRFFPEPWQVALVLRPHTLNPTRAGFFFRESDGSLHAAASYAEIVLRPDSQNLPPPEEMAAPERPAGLQDVPVMAPAAVPPQTAETAQPAPAPHIEQDAGTAQLPRYIAVEAESPRRRRGAWVTAGLLAAVFVGALAVPWYWLGSVFSERPVPLGLFTIEQNGQLLVHWNGNASLIRKATSGALMIEDGTNPIVFRLDPAHLHTGSFTYARKTGKVNVSLITALPNGQNSREKTSFLGPVPPHSADGEETIRKERDELLRENRTLKADLERESARSRRLEKQNQYLGRQLDQALQNKRARKQAK